MEKEEIIKNLISGVTSVGGSIIKNEMSTSGYSQQTYSIACVDLNKLATFLAKYVVKENLIED